MLAFFAAQFTAVFRDSNLGTLLAVKGRPFCGLQLPVQLTIVVIILITVLVDMMVGSASAKWAFMAPILVPMLMQVGAFARADSGRLSHRRFHHQHHHAAHALLSVDRCLLSALREEHGDRNAGGADAAVLAHLPRHLDRAAHRLLDVKHPAGAAGELTRIQQG